MKRTPSQFLNDKWKGLSKKLFQKYVAHEDLLIPIRETEPEDVFIIGYPKSGNTWMQSLISSLVYGIEPSLLPLNLSQELVPDINIRHFYKRYGERTFFKSHDLPKAVFQKVVYLVRDGRDAMLSYHHMYQMLGRSQSLEDMIRGKVNIFPSLWHEHILAWQKNPHSAAILVIKYEDLLKNTSKELKRLCEFIEIERSTEWIDSVVEGHSFKNMKARAATQKFGHKLLEDKNAAGFFRSGRSGDYKKKYSDELLHYFNEQSKEALKIHNYL